MLTRQGYILDKSKYNKNYLKVIKDELTVEPFVPDAFKFGKQQDMKFKVYKESDEYLAIPKYYGCTKIGKPKKIDFGQKNKAKIKFKGDLREYQKKIMDIVIPKMKKDGGGLISIPPGRGKTVLAIYLASQLKCRTLVLVHKTFLMEQWEERIRMFTNSSVGKIQRKTVDVDHDFVIGMIQSISMKDDYDLELFEMFDFVIVDESHHISSKVFSRCLLKMTAPYMLGLSATFKRKDRLDKVFRWHVGDILYVDSELVECKKMVERYFFTSKYDTFKEHINRYNGRANLAKMYTELIDIKDRKKFIRGLVKDVYQRRPGTKALFLSQRIDDIKQIKNI